ncbi:MULTISPECIES: AAA family ATPase [unclassified Acidovorax]|uniref:AAA family ATPase n=1 Tax=unclassified Acidovorax TaxID=2684926 RepID=UPI002882EBE4|nr:MULTISPECIES: AAA family ATPase [unclassified Acidovorax]
MGLKNYKVYKNVQFIPISSGASFTAYLGPNGIGKTSIFEALDKFFNGGEWIANNESKKGSDDSAFVSPLFLIPVGDISLTKKEKRLASLISAFFWDFSGTPYNPFVKSVIESIASATAMGYNKESHYLFLLGNTHQTNEIEIPFFGNDIKKVFDRHADVEYEELADLLKKVKSHYRYIYLPAEADSLTFSRMESIYIRKLLDEDIKKKIQESISKNSIEEINKKLKEFIDQINKTLDQYVYKGKRKDQLTANDLIERIFSAYFGIKVLHKKNGGRETTIKDLSSGEKRQALIDLSYALISRSKLKEYQVILAIDEPDASMHVAACHDQFEKIARIPTLCTPAPQVLINTHWYGFLPVIRSGVAHSLSRVANVIEFFSFNLENFREYINQNYTKSHGKYPKEVELKSYQDMIQSVVVSMLRDKPYNWIFCEGLSDKIYLTHYLSALVENNNLRIVPLGGFKQVRRVYDYLSAPLSDKEAGFKGKALCIVDTDAQKEHVELRKDSKNLFFKRLVRDESKLEVVAHDADSQHSFPTEIEFALREEVLIKLLSSPEHHKNMENFAVLQEIVKTASVTQGSNNLYDYMNLGPKQKKQLMDDFFDVGNNKVNFANAYIACDSEKISEPKWMDVIRQIIKG